MSTKFDESAKAKSASAFLSTVKWSIWLVTGALLLLLGSTYTGKESDGFLILLAVIAIGGYYLGVGVEKYRQMIIKEEA